MASPHVIKPVPDANAATIERLEKQVAALQAREAERKKPRLPSFGAPAQQGVDFHFRPPPASIEARLTRLEQQVAVILSWSHRSMPRPFGAPPGGAFGAPYANGFGAGPVPGGAFGAPP